MKNRSFLKLALGVILMSSLSVSAISKTDKNENWRVLNPENTLYIDTKQGQIIVELMPEFAPLHVERIKLLTQKGFYDYLTFHRVIDGFMAQGGDPTGTGMGGSDEANIPAEFFIRRSPEKMKFNLYHEQVLNPREAQSQKIKTGFYKGFYVGTEAEAQAGLTKDKKVKSWLMHCPGVASMARSADPDSANSQFFLMRGNAPWLDQNYSPWGRVVMGQNYVDAIKEGTVGQNDGFKPDYIKKVQLASDLPESERKTIEVMRTDTESFKERIDQMKQEKGADFTICDVSIPARIK